jgi:hypothetical protein
MERQPEESLLPEYYSLHSDAMLERWRMALRRGGTGSGTGWIAFSLTSPLYLSASRDFVSHALAPPAPLPLFQRVRAAMLWTIGTVTVKCMSGLDLDPVVQRGQTIRCPQ